MSLIFSSKSWLSDDPSDHKAISAQIMPTTEDMICAEVSFMDDSGSTMFSFFIHTEEDLEEAIGQVRQLRQVLGSFFRALKLCPREKLLKKEKE